MGLIQSEMDQTPTAVYQLNQSSTSPGNDIEGGLNGGVFIIVHIEEKQIFGSIFPMFHHPHR